MPELIVTLSDGRTRKQALTESLAVLGRDPACDIVLDDPSSSRQHARLRWDQGRYSIEDLGSKNGTLVNDERVQVRELNHLDEILIGSVELRFVDESSTDSRSNVVIDDRDHRFATTSFASKSDALNLTERRLQLIYDLSERLTTLRDPQALLEDALDICFEMLRFERGAIAVRKAAGRGVDWPVVRNLRGAGGELTISRSILGRALDHGERAIINDVGSGPIDPTVSMVQHGIRSAMCVPLTHAGAVLGVIYGDRTSTGTAYGKEDVDFLAGLGRQVTIGLVNARLLDEQKAKLELEAELGVAREIQQRLFPRVFPNRSGMGVAAINDPGRTVSGDYYDVIAMADGRLGFLIADVSGKGVSAALLTCNLQAAVRLTLPNCEDLGAMMAGWNNLICDNTDSAKFVTCLCGAVSRDGRELSYVTAGHPPPMILCSGSGEIRALSGQPGFPLGVVEDTSYGVHTVKLDSQPCTIFCFSDGVIEAMNATDEQFGDARMVESLRECVECPPPQLLRRMRKSIGTFCRDAPQSDDITMVAVQVGSP